MKKRSVNAVVNIDVETVCIEQSWVSVAQRMNFRSGGYTLKGSYSENLDPAQIPALLDRPHGRVVLARKGEFTMVCPTT